MSSSPVADAVHDARYDFEKALRDRKLSLPPTAIDTLQINITKLCNQACKHCHVDSSPKRKETMSRRGVETCVSILAKHPQIKTVDITGGAPELNADFDWFVEECTKLGRKVIVRHNLTVQFDGNPVTKEKKEYLPEFFANNRCEVVSSLPYYQEFFTDRQRGSGVFKKSIQGLQRLNEVGYGKEGTGLVLDLVYNPVGPYLPAAQAALEADYKETREKFGIVFNKLFTITNMPINRFRNSLQKTGQYEEYMEKLLAAFNPAAAENVMCRNLISVDYDGRIYDCDFNQQIDMRAVDVDGKPASIFTFDFEKVLMRKIKFDSHCFGCTAGAGSSCGGAVV